MIVAVFIISWLPNQITTTINTLRVFQVNCNRWIQFIQSKINKYIPEFKFLCTVCLFSTVNFRSGVRKSRAAIYPTRN
jgi:hypothetical protein